jgi:hypothetical protein
VLMPIARGNHIGITLYGGTGHPGQPHTVSNITFLQSSPLSGHHANKTLTPGSPFEALGQFAKGLYVCPNAEQSIISSPHNPIRPLLKASTLRSCTTLNVRPVPALAPAAACSLPTPCRPASKRWA